MLRYLDRVYLKRAHHHKIALHTPTGVSVCHNEAQPPGGAARLHKLIEWAQKSRVTSSPDGTAHFGSEPEGRDAGTAPGCAPPEAAQRHPRGEISPDGTAAPRERKTEGKEDA